MRQNGSTAVSARHTDADPHDHDRDDPPSADTLDALREDLSMLRRDVTQLARHGREEFTHRAADLADRARDRADRARKSVGGFAAERPFTTIALAVAGGVLLASMCPRVCRR